FETFFSEEEVEVIDGILRPKDLATIVVFERHGRTGGRAKGLVGNIGLKNGAIASTVSHDCHNLVVLGMNPEDMLLAAETLIKAGGGMAAVRDGRVLASVELPIAGLMSEADAEEVAMKLEAFREAEEGLGLKDYGPMLLITLLSLPVIPHARITDKGLFDVDGRRFVPLFFEEAFGGYYAERNAIELSQGLVLEGPHP
ncbi:MAG: adenine deaminase C-terminal domain-containing protein, partial [Candidatus Bathyarchaeia archaeon]